MFGEYTMQIFWIVLLIVFAIAEGATASLVSIWFCAGAVVALLVSFFVPSVAGQIAVFLVVSGLVLVLLRPYARRRLMVQRVATNADQIVGKQGRMLLALAPPESGRVRVDGVDWNARSETPLAKDALVRVVALEGTTLVVAPL